MRRLLVLLCLAAATLASAPSAGATIFNVIATNEGGDPLDTSIVTIADNENLWAYVTSASGGLVCVHSVPVSTGASCDDAGAWSAVPVPPFFAGPMPVGRPPLRPGLWQLIAVDNNGLNAESDVFAIEPCVGACPIPPGSDPTNFETVVNRVNDAADAAKAAFRAIYTSVKTICGLTQVLGLAQRALETERLAEWELAAGTSPGAAIGMGVAYFTVSTAADMTIKTVIPDAVPFLPSSVGMPLWWMCKTALGVSYPDNPVPFTGDLPGAQHVNGVLEAVDGWINDPAAPYLSVEKSNPVDWPRVDTTGVAPSIVGSAKQVDLIRADLTAGTAAFERLHGAIADAPAALPFVHAQSAAVDGNFSSLRSDMTSFSTMLNGMASTIRADPGFVDSATQDELDLVGAAMARVRDTGFTTAELEDLRAHGWSEASIADLRDSIGRGIEGLTPETTLSGALVELSSNLKQATQSVEALSGEAALLAGRTNVAPIAGFSASPTSGAPPLEVSLHDTSTSPDLDPVVESWDFGDGSDPGGGVDVTHTYSAPGTYEVTLTVSDGIATDSATQEVTVTSGGGGTTNHSPVAQNDVLSAVQGSNGSVNVLSNDSDPDGDALRVTHATNGTNGLVLCSTDGSCTYSPTGLFVGSDSFTYTVSDPSGATATGTVDVTVSARQENPPAAQPDQLGTTPGNSGTIDVLANDSDPDGDPLTIVSVTAPQFGAVSCTPSGLCTYTPNEGIIGGDSFGYTISDGRGGTASTTVTVFVGPQPGLVDDTMTLPRNAQSTVQVLDNDTGNGLYVTGVSTPAHGAVTCGLNACTYTSGPDYTGPDSFTYTATNGFFTGTANVSVTVLDRGNAAPTPVDDAVVATWLGTTVLNVLGNDTDPDGDHLAVTSATQGTSTSVYCPADGNCVIQSYALGPDSFTYTVTDEWGATATATVSIDSVRGADAPPVANPDSLASFSGVAATANVLANDVDPESDPLTIVGFTQPAGGTVTCSDSNCTYVPRSDFTGRDSFSYTIDDGLGGQADGTVSIVVEAACAATQTGCPFERGDIFAGVGLGHVDQYHADGRFVRSLDTTTNSSEETGMCFDAQKNLYTTNFERTNVSKFDSSGHLIAAEFIHPSAAGDVESCVVAKNGHIFVGQPDGEFQVSEFDAAGTPLATYNLDRSRGGDWIDLASDGCTLYYTTEASDVRRFDVCANKQLSDFATSLNDEPCYALRILLTGGVAVACSSEVLRLDRDGQIVQRYAPVGGLQNDIFFAMNVDPDGQSFWTAGYSNGRLYHFDFATGALLGTIDAGHRGDVLSGLGIFGELTASSNQAPVAADATVGTPQDVAVGVTLHADDPDGDALTYAVVSGPSHGTLTGTAPDLSYTPNAGFFGTDSFTFKASDSALDSNLATVSITVTHVNRAPVAVDQSLSTPQDTAVPVTLHATDPDIDALTYAIGASPSHGSLTGVAPALTYTPTAGYVGPDSFSFRANDGALDSNLATVSITVTRVDHAPSCDDLALSVDQGAAGDVAPSCHDADLGDTLSYMVASQPTSGTVSIVGGEFHYVPQASASGTDSFTYAASDGEIASAPATVRVTIVAPPPPPTNRPPVCTDSTASTTTTTPINSRVACTDPDADLLTYNKVSGPSHGTLTFNADGTYRYVAASGYTGLDSFVFAASDGRGGSGQASVAISVVPLPDTTPATCRFFFAGTDAFGNMLHDANVRDTGSGVATINVLVSQNATVQMPAFAVGTTKSIVVQTTVINPDLPNEVELEVRDVAGNRTTCDPILTTLHAATIGVGGKPHVRTFVGVPQQESKLRIRNGKPGLRSIEIVVNGRRFTISRLAPGKTRLVDVHAAMRAGPANTITLTGRGPRGATATIMIHD